MTSTGLTDRMADGIGWREGGTGEPVVFLHAMVTSRLGWENQMLALAPQFRCIAWDMPGYGLSAPAPAETGMAYVLDRLQGFVRGTLDLKSAHFVGLSVGGMIIQHLAAARPDMLRSMSLIDCSPKFGFGGGSDPDAFEAWVASELDRKPLATFNEEMIRAIVSPRASEEAVAQAVCAMAPASRSGLELAARLIARHDAMDILPGIARPALVMAGEDDAETPPSYAQAIAARIPNANLSIVRGAGHIANIEAGDAVTARLRTFLTYSI